MYTGIQDRARNSQVISLVNQWESTLAIYNAQKDTYPTSSILAEYTCLGTDFPAEGPFAEGQCMKSGWTASTDQTMMDSIRNEVGVQMPPSRLSTVSFVDGVGVTQQYRGLLYLSRNNGVGITYVLKGTSHECTDGDGFFELGGYVACRRVLKGDPYQGL
jgi:hypothetical protein